MIAKVLIEISNINVDKAFDYIVPKNLESDIKIGIRVKAPFNHQILEGFVMDLSPTKTTNYDLKTITDIVDIEPILTDELLNLGKYMSKTYYSTLISCYQTMLPKALKAQNSTNIKKKTNNYIRLKLNKDEIDFEKLNSSQNKIIEELIKCTPIEKKILNNISASSVKTLLKNGVVEEFEEEYYRFNANFSQVKNRFELTDEQEKAKQEILSYQGQSKTFLLHGITGSGKTAVYLEIVEQMLKEGKDSIFLVPEISLTPQMVNYFKSRFGDEVAILHSKLNEGEKYDEYRKIVSGKVHIVVGARSAIFAPFKNIGAIIIDEEHTGSYKQDNNPKYNAIDIAIHRGKYHHSLVILGSATPSVTSYAKALKGIYQKIDLKNRINGKPLPHVEIIDMSKEHNRGAIFSGKLISSIQKCIDSHEQVILLLNRRGYAPFITCSNCGYTAKCPHCDITLTYHKSSNTLRCHYCGYADKMQENCPSCGEKSIKNLGLGTEKVEEEIKKLTSARVVRMDLDTTVRKGSHERIIEDFRNKKYDILLGTQMIAKGLDFENVTLVGIINADTSLMIPNYTSSEATFQLLMQTSGRSGRGSKEGNVIIQTFNPNHYAIKLAKTHNYLEFFKEEMNIRHKLSYPPYFYLIYIRVIGKDYDIVLKESNKIGNFLRKELTSSIILGPTTCNIFMLGGKYRFGILIKYKKDDKIPITLNSLIDHYRGNNKIKIDIDINPNNF